MRASVLEDAGRRSLARGHTELCVRVLAGIVSQKAVPPAARVSAVGLLLERRWGKAPQAATGDPDSPLIVEIIQRVREAK
jgi:hypothetical protein